MLEPAVLTQLAYEHGRVAVRVGCVKRKVDGGEHSVVMDGHWSVIDRHRRELVPLAEHHLID